MPRLRQAHFHHEEANHDDGTDPNRDVPPEAATWRRPRLERTAKNPPVNYYPSTAPAAPRCRRSWHSRQRSSPWPNIFLQRSLDATTPRDLYERARFLAETHPRAYLSFLRTRPDDDTKGAAIVFNEKRTKGLPYHGRTDCPVDAGRMPLGNIRGIGGTACALCRKCFSEATVERQKAVIER